MLMLRNCLTPLQRQDMGMRQKLLSLYQTLEDVVRFSTNIIGTRMKLPMGSRAGKKELVDNKIELIEANDGKGVFLIQPRLHSDRLYSYFGLQN